MEQKPIDRIAAIGDLHMRTADKGKWSDLFAGVGTDADVLLLCGDLTDSGEAMDAELLVAELSSCTIPVLAVLGNHDYDKGQQKNIRRILEEAKITVLDGDLHVIGNVGFAGIKGFCGGFGSNVLTMFGEDLIKEFVQKGVNEALRLEHALSKLDANPFVEYKIAITHYSPVIATLKGESEQLYPFLGSSRLAEPMARNYVSAAFHGHAHNGVIRGNIDETIPVFNVSRQVLVKEKYNKPYFVFELGNR